MSSNAATRLTIQANGDDPLETVRRAVAFADEMITAGATVVVTGDLSMIVRFEKDPEDNPLRQDNLDGTTGVEVTDLAR